MATPITNPPPQSWPTRSTGSPIASSSPRASPVYSCIVAPNPAGDGTPKPGRFGVEDVVPTSCSTNGPQIAGVSGLPWTSTTVIS